MVNPLLWLAAAAAILVIARLWRIGAEQPTEPLPTRAVLRASLELLWRRGVDGTRYILEFPSSGRRIVVTKRLSGDGAVAFYVSVSRSLAKERLNKLEDGGELPQLGDSLQPIEGTDRERAVADAIALIDQLADTIGVRLFPDAQARFEGRVLSFNLPSRTGSDT